MTTGTRWETETWTVRGVNYTATLVELPDGQEGILLTSEEDPRWDEVWTLTEQQSTPPTEEG